MKKPSTLRKQVFIIFGLVAAIALVIFSQKEGKQAPARTAYMLIGQPLLPFPLKELNGSVSQSEDLHAGAVALPCFTLPPSSSAR